MTSREQEPDHTRCQATIDRISLDLAHERAANASLREELATTQRRVRTWQRVAKWIFYAKQERQHPFEE